MIKSIVSYKTKGWEKRLETFIRSRADIPFAWGSNDCVSFTADCIKEMTRQDVIAWGRGKYKNKAEALEVLKGQYGMGMYRTFDRIFTEEMEYHESDCLGCGDIGFVQMENRDTVASEMFDYLTLVTCVDNSGTVICPSEEGLTLTKNYLMVKAWTP